MLVGIGSTIPRIANLPGPSRPGGGGSSPFEYTAIDNNFSMEFDAASSEYIDCGYFPQFSGATKSSFSFWLNRTTTSPNHIFGINVSSFNRIGCTIVSDTINFYIGGINGFITNFITTNGWYHIAIVYDYSESVNADRIKIYLNGVPTSCGNVVSSSFPALNANLKLGTFTTQYLTGGLDEFAIFPNIALSQSTIEAIYNTTNDNPGKAADLTETPEGAPVAWYRMGD